MTDNGIVRRVWRWSLPLAGAMAFVVWGAAVHAQGRQDPTRAFSLISGGVQIGATLRDVEAADVTREKLTGQAGAIIADVAANGPAARAGLRSGDVVVTFDGEQVRSARHLQRLIEETPDGREVAAIVIRGGERVNVKIAPTASGPFRYVYRQPDQAWTVGRFTPDTLRYTLPKQQMENFTYLFGLQPAARLGVSVQNLTTQLAEYFGTTGGALVTEVEDNSTAKTAGLRSGDVITKVNDRVIGNTEDLRRHLGPASGETTITVMRDRKEITLKVKLDELVR
jgi:serine protease Do